MYQLLKNIDKKSNLIKCKQTYSKYELLKFLQQVDADQKTLDKKLKDYQSKNEILHRDKTTFERKYKEIKQKYD